MGVVRLSREREERQSEGEERRGGRKRVEEK